MSVRPLLVALTALLLLCACGKEVRWVDATQVIVTVRSDLTSDLAKVEAAVFDASGQKRGAAHVFTLSDQVALPLSFSIVPTLPETEQFMVVLTGRGLNDQALVETRAIVSFVRRKTVAVQLWLYAGCQTQGCNTDQTCARTEASTLGCIDIPTLTTVSVKPGDELDAAVFGTDELTDDGAVEAAAPGNDARIADSGVDAAVDSAITQDANSDMDSDAGALPPEPSGPCIASAGQPTCADNVLHQCDAQGNSTKQDRCASARQCQLGLSKSTCAPCNPGTFRCQNVKLERCGTDGFTWESFKTCASEALCNVEAGDCTMNACTATTRVCKGDDLYGCNEELTQLTRLKGCDAGMCDNTNGQCDVCLAKSSSCNGDSVESCDDAGQAISSKPCPTATPKCTGNGQCVQCLMASHCTAPTNQCQSATCSGSPPRCGTTNKAARQPCSGGVCDGSGSCVQCVQDGDCSGKLGKCLNKVCVACKANTDCGGGFECDANSHTCKQVSLAGTAGSCLSYTAATSSQCGGYYCGVTTTMLSSALVPTAVCNLPSTLACSGALLTKSDFCWRRTLSMNPLDSQAQLRPKVLACLTTELGAQVSGVNTSCIDCFLNATACTYLLANCLTDCVDGDSAPCDTCRRAKGCVQPLFGCGGLPSPF